MTRPVATPEDLCAQLAGASRVVFDLDGTLYDTRDFERPALAAVADWLRERSAQPLPGLTQALWSRRESDRHRRGLFDELLSQHGLPVSWGAECVRRFHDYPGFELRQADSLKPHLEKWRSDGCRLALVSNGYAALQERKLAMLGLGGAFDVCIYCDPRVASQLKPSVWAWQELAGWRAALPTVYVGDDPVDAEFAQAGGARFVEFWFRSGSYDD